MNRLKRKGTEREKEHEKGKESQTNKIQKANMGNSKKDCEKDKSDNVNEKRKEGTLNKEKENVNARTGKEKEKGQSETQQRDCEINMMGRNKTNEEKQNQPTDSEREKEKRTITLKEYEARRMENTKESKSGDWEVNKIMAKMTETCSFMQMRPLTPLEEGLSSCVCIYTEEQSDPETANAVEALQREVIQETNEKDNQIDCFSENTVEAAEFEILDNIVEDIVEEVIRNEGPESDQESERLRRRTEKRKREVDEGVVENLNRKRRISETVMCNLDDETEYNMMETDDDLKILKEIQSDKVILNIGGARFETSRLTLRKDPESLLAKLFTTESSVAPRGNSVFIDRDASHFKVILNYLRYALDINAAILPRERKYLLELKKECEYYRVQGLLEIVKRRLHYVTELYGMD